VIARPTSEPRSPRSRKTKDERSLSPFRGNKDADFMGLSRYAEHGSPSENARFDLYVKAKRPFDAYVLAASLARWSRRDYATCWKARLAIAR
jgi:hypothetical protein